ncbi:MAG TPA: 4-alpha-glucanotransferase [Spirochaetota bacterium]|nr:4-alpha-glucanotransferase [Spirochaetota bacterium]
MTTDNKRASGILLHPTSLPGRFGIGQLGDECFKFIDFLHSSGQTLWQILPFHPTGFTNCPYSTISAFSGNPYLISYDILINEGYLSEDDIPKYNDINPEKVDFGKVYETVYQTLKKAFNNFKNKCSKADSKEFEDFCKEADYWLDDYTLFAALKNNFDGKPWFLWDNDIKFREKKAVQNNRKVLSDEIDFQKFLQFKFFQQWKAVKKYANDRGIKIISDIPLYIAHDSADVWSHPEFFQMDETLNPITKAGVPPDYFSATGQLWGNPLYDWEKLKNSDFEWWIERIKLNIASSDILRFDHFRGFSAYWSVPWQEETAINGRWEKAYGSELFEKVRKLFGNITMIAEDLGLITDDVIKLRDDYGFLGMKILQFAFDSNDKNDFLPHNYNKNSIVYTGALDNDTINGWYDNANENDKNYFCEYSVSDGKNPSWDMIRSAWASVSQYAVTTMQDILSLDSNARMNTPGTVFGNWEWRYKNGDLNEKHINMLKKITDLYQRK